ncbi:MAG TPA: SDR family oxidoreductase [Flavobacteriales bacterium]|jgi:nucleoside-diphosphate-sugar epimerase|nr:SDR family oxidoreductase [Flavobacteriales bacterium]MBK7114217.1 SDR family oxidoreductase [Flavobacteriales bacterium]HQW06078.1 SDR family oxidoreductase [Flavobacteriales bacterium]HQX00274.1 SDR family oxidoreductase [Flavobacteriales bacterium]HQX99199.1 SDR family oxidoreductase [Flavobacteriales bacterium]
MTSKNIFITGGAGYVGSVLVPKLLDKGYSVTVLDLMIYGEEVLPKHERLNAVKGDIRDQALLKKLLPGHDAVIHLACISNDPSFELNPDLGKSINLDAFEPLVRISKESGIGRFIYASSSSVYGIKEEPNVTEDMVLEPLTDYSKFKAQCEEILDRFQSDDFTTVTIRPATVCGYGKRLRLDLSVNILTNLAVNKGEITVFGGTQKRPNIHIEDMTDLYVQLLELPKERIAGKIWNAGYDNFTIAEIAGMVRNVIGEHVKIVTTPTDDLRSYHVSSEKIKNDIGFVATHSLEDAVRDLKKAFDAGAIPDSLTNDLYFNVKRMQRIHLN